MTQTRFTPEEKEIMAEVLAGAISELSSEISHTDLLEFREGLKERKQRLLACLEKLKH